MRPLESACMRPLENLGIPGRCAVERARGDDGHVSSSEHVEDDEDGDLLIALQ